MNRAERMAAIVARLSRPGYPPFIATAAEACGVNRHYVHEWLKRGKQGDPEFAQFAADVYRLRAEFVETLTADLMKGGDLSKGDLDANKHKAWLLGKLDRETFDPPKEQYEKSTKRPEDQPTTATAPADLVASAAALLSARDDSRH